MFTLMDSYILNSLSIQEIKKKIAAFSYSYDIENFIHYVPAMERSSNNVNPFTWLMQIYTITCYILAQQFTISSRFQLNSQAVTVVSFSTSSLIFVTCKVPNHASCNLFLSTCQRTVQECHFNTIPRGFFHRFS